MKYKIIYTLPLSLLIKKHNEKNIRDILIKMLYGLLTVNANISSDITIYTDFDGMSVLSVLPFNFNIIYANNEYEFNKKVISLEKNNQYIIFNENHILKMPPEFNGEYIIDLKINDNAILKNISVDEIELKLKDISETIYNKYIDNINIVY